MGYDSVRLLSQILSGEVTASDVDQIVKTGAVVARCDNMNDQ